MKKEHQNPATIGIIGGADGPTSVFISNNKMNRSIKQRLKKYIRHCKRKKAAKEIVAGTHTIEELVQYAKSTYGAVEANHKLGELPAISCIYEIKIENGYLDIEIDDTRETFGVSYSGKQRAMKYFRAVVKDLYLYYGVSEEDMRHQTERYLALLNILSM